MGWPVLDRSGRRGDASAAALDPRARMRRGPVASGGDATSQTVGQTDPAAGRPKPPTTPGTGEIGTFEVP